MSEGLGIYMQENSEFNKTLKQIAIKNGVDLQLLEGSQSQQIRRLCLAVAQEAREIVRARYMGDNNREDMEVRRVEQALVKHLGIGLVDEMMPKRLRSGRQRSPD